MIKAYIAAKFSQRAALREVAQRLLPVGIAVNARWIWEDEKDFHELVEADAIDLAARDIEDISTSNILIIDTTEPLSHDGGGGREFEMGYAISDGKDIWRVGPVKNVFHFMVARHFMNWEELINERSSKSI